jgi:hypothetical protein
MNASIFPRFEITRTQFNNFLWASGFPTSIPKNTKILKKHGDIFLVASVGDVLPALTEHFDICVVKRFVDGHATYRLYAFPWRHVK